MPNVLHRLARTPALLVILLLKLAVLWLLHRYCFSHPEARGMRMPVNQVEHQLLALPHRQSQQSKGE